MNRPQAILCVIGIAATLSGIVLVGMSHPWIAGLLSIAVGWVAFSAIENVK